MISIWKEVVLLDDGRQTYGNFATVIAFVHYVDVTSRKMYVIIKGPTKYETLKNKVKGEGNVENFKAIHLNFASSLIHL